MKRFGETLVNLILWPVSSDAAVKAIVVLALVVTGLVLMLALR